MIRWKNLKPDIRSIDIRKNLKSYSFIDTYSLLKLSESSPIIIFPFEVKKKIYNFLSNGDIELGGLLVGSVFSYDNLNNGIVLIEIQHFIESEDFEASPVSLRMESSIWQSLNHCGYVTKEVFLIGWFHSHPNLGAFFSSTDRKTQKAFFNQNYSLGLVIDPVRNEEKWFIGPDSTEIPRKNIL